MNKILEIIGEVWGTEAIVSCLKDKGIYVVMRATDVLGKMKDPIAVEPLINAFMETRNYNREGKRYSKDYIQTSESIRIESAKSLVKIDTTKKNAVLNLRKRVPKVTIKVTLSPEKVRNH